RIVAAAIERHGRAGIARRRMQRDVAAAARDDAIGGERAAADRADPRHRNRVADHRDVTGVAAVARGGVAAVGHKTDDVAELRIADGDCAGRDQLDVTAFAAGEHRVAAQRYRAERQVDVAAGLDEDVAAIARGPTRVTFDAWIVTAGIDAETTEIEREHVRSGGGDAVNVAGVAAAVEVAAIIDRDTAARDDRDFAAILAIALAVHATRGADE